MKLVDQIRGELVKEIIHASGMPRGVADAYIRHLDELLIDNSLAGGVGAPHKRKCGIPHGVPVFHGHYCITYAAVDCANEESAGYQVLYPRGRHPYRHHGKVDDWKTGTGTERHACISERYGCKGGTLKKLQLRDYGTCKGLVGEDAMGPP